MPLVIICSGSISRGQSELFVMEHIAGVRISQFLDCTKKQASTSISLNNGEFTQLLGVAHTEHERQCICYIAWAFFQKCKMPLWIESYGTTLS